LRGTGALALRRAWTVRSVIVRTTVAVPITVIAVARVPIIARVIAVIAAAVINDARADIAALHIIWVVITAAIIAFGHAPGER
jgi:hypothetical protein